MCFCRVHLKKFWCTLETQPKRKNPRTHHLQSHSTKHLPEEPPLLWWWHQYPTNSTTTLTASLRWRTSSRCCSPRDHNWVKSDGFSLFSTNVCSLPAAHSGDSNSMTSSFHLVQNWTAHRRDRPVSCRAKRRHWGWKWRIGGDGARKAIPWVPKSCGGSVGSWSFEETTTARTLSFSWILSVTVSWGAYARETRFLGTVLAAVSDVMSSGGGGWSLWLHNRALSKGGVVWVAV